ncbi:MAG TPA: hypothetical protein VKW76_11225 [Candidatus Binatia bacterium]|nr:hypothetical protein [Candidatus Binatia bacterium]
MPRAVAAAVLVALAGAAPARAAFHISVIDEINAKAGGNPAEQYVQVRMLTSFQNFVAHARLTAFNCDGSFDRILLELPSNVPNQGADLRWIAATSPAAAGGIAPDFTIPPGIPATCGMICWGAPGILPPNPPTWDEKNPANYVDCVAYGGFTGRPSTTGGMPTPLPPGDGTHGLVRTNNTHDDAADFALACPHPTNDAGQTGTLGPCAPPTTTTTTTTTTLPPLGGCASPEAAAAVRAEIASACPCAAATSHRAYTRCAADTIRRALGAGMLPRSCKGAVRRCAAGSTCGRPGLVACCRITASGARKCTLKRRAACRAPKGGSLCPETPTSCCDACGGPMCTAAALGAPAPPPRSSTTTTLMYGY